MSRARRAARLTLLQHLLGLWFRELDEHVPEADHGLLCAGRGGKGKAFGQRSFSPRPGSRSSALGAPGECSRPGRG